MKNSGSAIRRVVTLLLLFSGVALHAQTGDVTGISMRLVAIDAGTIEIQLRPNNFWEVSDGVLNTTFAIRWESAAGGSLGFPVQSDPCFQNGAPIGANSGVNNVDQGGFRYRGYSGGNNALPDGCGYAANVWHPYARIPVTGLTGCATFQIVTSDAYTAANNTDYFMSLGGYNITANSPVVGSGLQMGVCGSADCLGVIGGSALPGTSCNDNNACTVNDTWNDQCQCVGTPVAAPSITSSGSNSPICAGESLSLNVAATTTSGTLTYTWTGTGTFSPNNTSANVTVTGAATGNYQVTVGNGCATSQTTVPVVVNTPPATPTPGSYGPYCSNAGAVTLGGTPAGGVWTGTGVSGSGPYTFSPSAGSQSLTYTVSGNGCSSSASTFVTVDQQPAAPVPGSYGPLCSTGSSITLGGTPAGGVWTGTGVSGTGPYGFSPSSGTQTLTCTVTNNGCSNNAQVQIVVNDPPATPTTGSYGPYCSNDDPVVLGGSPAGGVWTGTGVSGSGPYSFAPSAGSQTLTYTIGPVGCTSNATTGVVVNDPPPTPTTGSYGPLCNDAAPIQLGGSPANGVWTGTGVSAGPSYTFDPSAGSQSITYTVSSNGCSSSASTPVAVGPCDCAGVVNGTAFIDGCDDCVGGNTGASACDNDCANVPGGTASVDQCGICSGGTTGIVPNSSCTDCAGIVNGTAITDDCGSCVGGTTGEEACTADCLGVFGGSATAGTPCADPGEGMTNGFWNNDCECEGTPVLEDDCLGVAGGSAQPGTACADPGEGMTNGFWNNDCECEGTPVLEDDCLGVAGGSAQPGTACDDPGEGMENGFWNNDCECAGTPVVEVDCLGIPGGSAMHGTECDLGFGSVNGYWDAECNCVAGAEPDCLGVIGGAAQPGTPCDDGDDDTIGDTWSLGCVCSGTPVIPCTEELVIEFQTDEAASETSWQILSEGSLTQMCNGGELPDGEILTQNCCLPEGCYVLRVHDSAGDGMTTGSNGGYILRYEGLGGARIIDNRNNFLNGDVSAIMGDESFCLPLGTNRTIYTSCDKLDWVNDQFIVASLDPQVNEQWAEGSGFPAQSTTTGYEYWFFDPNGTYSYRVFKSLSNGSGIGATYARAAHLRINGWAVENHIPAFVLMNVRVRAVVNEEPAEWGPACRFRIDPVAALCPVTKLMDIPGNQHISCGQWRQWATNQAVHARPVSGASQYQFRFRQPDENGFEVIRTTSGYFARLGWTNAPALTGTQYVVDVRAMKNGEWCEWGETCLINIGVPEQEGSQNSAIAADAGESNVELNMWPNPNRGDELYISLGSVPEGVETVQVDMFDMYGRLVIARAVAAAAGAPLNMMLDLQGDPAPGVYMMNITAGEEKYTRRLVIQR